MEMANERSRSFKGFFGCVHQEDPGLVAQRKRSQEIDESIKKFQKEQRHLYKLLLLGTGESGKSTFIRHMKILHSDYTTEEKDVLKEHIRNNLKEAILSLCRTMWDLNISPHDPDKHNILEKMTSSADDIVMDDTFYDHVTLLWEDPGVKDCYSRSNGAIMDSAKYFLERVDVIRQVDYSPCHQDILRARIITSTIQKLQISVQDNRRLEFELYDVGGQKGERRKWIEMFNNINAIIFIVDCCGYDVTVRENPQQNRLMEAITTFEQVWNNRFLRKVSIILFLNKIDLLEEKISQGRTFDKFVDSLRDGDPYYDFITTWHTWSGPKDKENREFMDSYPCYQQLHDDSPPDTAATSDEPCQPHSGRRGSSQQVGTRARKLSLLSGAYGRRESRKKSSFQLMEEKGIKANTIKTAVFIKRLFMHILSNPLPFPGHDVTKHRSSHEDHVCQTYYTCAVDKDTISKVFNGCKNFITYAITRNSVY